MNNRSTHGLPQRAIYHFATLQADFVRPFFLYFCLCCFLLSFSAPWAQENSVDRLLKTYHTRQQECLENVADNILAATPVRGLALLYLNKQIDRANQYIQSADKPPADLMANTLYLRALLHYASDNTILFPQTRHHLETQISRFIAENETEFQTSLETKQLNENRFILIDSTLLLFAQYVKNTTLEFSWSDKQKNEEKLANYISTSHDWLNRHFTHGLAHRSSPYYYYGLAGLLNLRDFAEDELLSKKAEGMIDILLAEMAQTNLDGFWGGARCASFENLLPLPGNKLPYLFFHHNTASPKLGIDPTTLLFSHSAYRPPRVVIGIGSQTNQRGSYSIQNRFLRDIPAQNKTLDTYQYAYVTPKYILGSFFLRDSPVPKQSRPWDLLLKNGRDSSHFFTFAGKQLFSGSKPPFRSKYYSWNATTMQYKNVLYCRFHRSDIFFSPTGKKFQNILYYVQLPTRLWVSNHLAPLSQENEWWFCEFESLYLAFRPLTGRGYWWRSATIADTPQTNSAILAFQELSPGFLLEVEEARNFSSFDSFKKQVRSSPLEIENQSVTFVSRGGDVFLFPRDNGNFLVNGQSMDPTPATYDLFQSPYVQSQFGSGYYEIEWGNETLIWDFSDPQNPQKSRKTTDRDEKNA